MSIRFDRFGLATTAALAALCLSACGGEPETEVDAAGAAETPASEAGASDGRDEARLAELDETLSDIPEEPADEAEADRLGALMIERMLLRHGDSRDVRRVRPLAMATQTRVAGRAVLYELRADVLQGRVLPDRGDHPAGPHPVHQQ